MRVKDVLTKEEKKLIKFLLKELKKQEEAGKIREVELLGLTMSEEKKLKKL